MVAEVDRAESIKAGQFRQLLRGEIEAHCAQFGLDAELVSHSHMKGSLVVRVSRPVLQLRHGNVPTLSFLTSSPIISTEIRLVLCPVLSRRSRAVIITHSEESTKDLTKEV